MSGKGAPGRRHQDLAKKLEVDQRRLTVMDGIAAGETYEQLAEKLSVSKATIAADWRAVLKTWKDRHADKAQEWLLVELRRLETLLNSIWDEATGLSEGETDGASPISWRQRHSAMERVLAIVDREIRLLALERHAGDSEDHPMFIRTIEVILPPDDEDDD